MPAAATRYLGGPFGYGRFFPDYLTGASPSAGSNFTLGLDSRWSWRFVQVRFLFTADANVANRYVHVDFTDPGGVAWVANGAGVVVTASTTNQEFQFQAHRTIAEWATGTPVLAPLADTFVIPGWQLRIVADNIQAGDTITGVRMYVEKFEVGATELEEGAVMVGAGRGA